MFVYQDHFLHALLKEQFTQKYKCSQATQD